MLHHRHSASQYTRLTSVSGLGSSAILYLNAFVLGLIQIKSNQHANAAILTIHVLGTLFSLTALTTATFRACERGNLHQWKASCFSRNVSLRLSIFATIQLVVLFATARATLPLNASTICLLAATILLLAIAILSLAFPHSKRQPRQLPPTMLTAVISRSSSMYSNSRRPPTSNSMYSSSKEGLLHSPRSALLSLAPYHEHRIKRKAVQTYGHSEVQGPLSYVLASPYLQDLYAITHISVSPTPHNSISPSKVPARASSLL